MWSLYPLMWSLIGQKILKWLSKINDMVEILILKMVGWSCCDLGYGLFSSKNKIKIFLFNLILITFNADIPLFSVTSDSLLQKTS